MSCPGCTRRPTWPSSRRSAPAAAGTSIPTPTPARLVGRRPPRHGSGTGGARRAGTAGRRHRLRSGAAAGPSRHRGPGHGVLPRQQRGRRRGLPHRVGERVLIVDWDVHHGNGTQAIFWDDPDVLYVSTHQHPLFPGTGRPDEVGGPGAPGLTLNMPLPPGATGDVVRAAIDEVARGTIEDFRPDWVLVSCGFDAHRPIRWASWSCRAGTSPSWPAWCRSSRPAPGGWPSSSRAATTRCRSRPRSRRRWAHCWGCQGHRPASTSGGPGLAQLHADGTGGSTPSTVSTSEVGL